MVDPVEEQTNSYHDQSLLSTEIDLTQSPTERDYTRDFIAARERFTSSVENYFRGDSRSAATIQDILESLEVARIRNHGSEDWMELTTLEKSELLNTASQLFKESLDNQLNNERLRLGFRTKIDPEDAWAIMEQAQRDALNVRAAHEVGGYVRFSDGCFGGGERRRK